MHYKKRKELGLSLKYIKEAKYQAAKSGRMVGIEFERTEVMKRVAGETVFVGVSLRSNVSEVAKSGK
ncbi:hypothetical protein SFC34_02455 [Priestia aryabhattai]|uniref:hypothetical protein n=1 Tax=Priestia aryabhattai TaxID=412384 RepID=UPI0008DE43F8|nr:hypothetical protein [Priestia aryabhattai]MBZ6487488.1 hypothetical protein [Priestia aryabhattai]MDH3114345.1 hypothetical protein [Priestia aryabhattai]MDH3126757.1 hypothetical protein [Priestia aryabhattai]OHY76097.1 hypothetical protein BCV52_15410 [Priestia aryabhattai]OVE37692.1 hypothetical protein CCZ20_10325 [Priestia aryabhattai]